VTKISSSAFDVTVPMTFARGRNGDVYGVNGRERGLRWDTITANAEGLGITAPTTKPTLTSSVIAACYYVSAVQVFSGGNGYEKSPDVTFDGTGGAAAKANVSYGRIVSVDMLNYGNRYTSPPTVSVAGPGYAPPTAPVFVVNVDGQIAGVSLTSLGSGYTSAPTISLSGGGGSNALLTCQINEDGAIDSINIESPGTGYTSAPTISFSGGGGSSAAATVVMAYEVSSVSVTTGGSGHSGTPYLRFAGTGGGAVAVCNVSGGVINSVDVLQGGSYRTPSITATVKPTPGTSRPTAQLLPVMAPCMRGKYWCAIRYVDDTDTPIPSSISELAEIELQQATGSITWTWSNTGIDARAAKIELWRTTADQALVLYRVASVPTSTTSYVDKIGDNELIDPKRPSFCTASASTDVVTCSGHGLSNGDVVTFSALTGGAGLTAGVEYYVVSATASTFKVSTTKGGTALNITSDLTDAVVSTGLFEALPIVLPNGQPNARRFTPPPQNKSSIVMFQDRAWYAVDVAGRKFDGTTDANAAEPNALYFSEVDEPESVPETNQLVLQQNIKGSDKITALMPFGAGMIIFQQRHAYRLSYVAQPVADASIALVCQRGCLNQRCWDVFDGVAYVVDSMGMYVLDGTTALPISDVVDTYWSNNVIHFPSSKWFFVRVDPITRIVRFFHAVSAGYPDRALCYSPVTKTWWLETYAQTFSASEVLVSGSRQTMLVGGQAGGLYAFDAGTQDLTSSDAVAGIACSYRTGNMAFSATESDRGIRVLYSPTSTDCTLALALHYNNSSTARPSAVRTDRGTGFTTDGGSSATLNMKLTRSALGDATGLAVCSYAGRLDDKSSGGDRHVAIDVSGTRAASNPLTLYAVQVGGVG
jgi:hypothetical protein